MAVRAYNGLEFEVEPFRYVVVMSAEAELWGCVYAFSRFLNQWTMVESDLLHSDEQANAWIETRLEKATA